MNVFVVVHEVEDMSATIVGVFANEGTAIQKALSLPTKCGPWVPTTSELEWENGYDRVYIEKWGVDP